MMMMQTDRVLALVLVLTGLLFLSRRNTPRATTSRIARLRPLRDESNLELSMFIEPRPDHEVQQRFIAQHGANPVFGKQWLKERRAILFLIAAVGVTFGPQWSVAAMVGWMCSTLLRTFRRSANQRKALARGLVDLVDDMARQVRGGRGVTAALLHAIANSSEELQQVLAPVVASLTIGSPPSSAIGALGAHHNNRDLHSLATLLGAGEQLGGIRPDALDGLTTMIRERTSAGADVATQAAQARVSAIVLGCAPIVFCGLLVLSDGRSSAFLLHSPLGLGCAVLGLVLDACGAVWMSTVTRRAIA
jgi:Flp pilus assembly protein TadB